MPGATHGDGAHHQQRGLRRQWPKVPRFDSPTHRRCSQNRSTRLGLQGRRDAAVHGATAWRRAAQPALSPGETSRWGVRVLTPPARAQPLASTQRGYLASRSASFGSAAGVRLLQQKNRRDARLSDTTQRRRAHGLRVVQVHRSRAHGGARSLALHHSPRRDGRNLTHSSHGDCGTQEHEQLRSSIHRDTAVLRHEGQHPGKI
jgi:hypothetical protein